MKTQINNLPIINQKELGYCVSIVVCQLMQLQYGYKPLSWQWLGYMADVADGKQNDGTDPERSFKVAKAIGVPKAGVKLEVTPEHFAMARENPLIEYKYYGDSFASLVLAIKENGFCGLRIPAGLLVQGDTTYHYVLVYSVDEQTKTIKFRNSWGKEWGMNGNGIVGWDKRMSHIITIKKPIVKNYKQEVMKIAVQEIGQAEFDGAVHNKRIIQYFDSVGHSWVKNDETFWCAAFAGFCLETAGIGSTRALNARSYLNFGKEAKKWEYGMLAIFSRGNNQTLGHIGFVVYADENYVWVLGGNQENAVNIRKYPMRNLLGFRDY